MQAATNPLALPAKPGSPRRQRLMRLLPGILLTGVIAILATELAKSAWMQANGISALTLAIVGGMIAAIVLSSTFVLSCWAGTRLFGLNRRTAMLIGAGSSICGAAAVMATEPVVRGRAEEVSIAVATVVAFGTLAIFIIPARYHLNNRMHGLSPRPLASGIFTESPFMKSLRWSRPARP